MAHYRMHAVLLVIALASCYQGAVAQELVFNTSIFLNPSVVAELDGAFSLNSTTQALNITTEVFSCDSQGGNCETASPEDVPLAVQLSCGNFFPPLELVYTSDRVASSQTVMISPKSPSYLLDGQPTAPIFTCFLLPKDYLPSVLRINITATAIENITELIQPEQEAALQIYETCCTGDTCDRWDEATFSAGSNSTFTDLCNMDGNLCTPEGNLVTLSLVGYGLACDLAALNFSNFTSLEYLYLSANNITGNFSAAAATAFEGLTLKELHIDYNADLGGELDSTKDGAVCGLVQGVGLEVIRLGSTSINGPLPACFFDATSSLKYFYASLSGISGELPAEFGEAANLQVFQSMGTGLSGALPAIPPGLVKLNISANALTGPIPDIASASKLTILDLSNNQLSDTLPSGFADHPSLRNIDLRVNNLSGLPAAWVDEGGDALTNEPPLSNILLADNPLQGVFPAGLEAYPSLNFLNLDNTTLTGTLPEVPEGGFPSLLLLYASNNALSGPIPESWGNTLLLSKNATDIGVPRWFVVANNSLSGDLPEFFEGPFINTYIDVRGNDFSNACEPQFVELGACNDPEAAAAAAKDAAAAAAEETDESTSSDTDADSGLSSGAVAGIVIAVLLLVGVGAFFGYRYWKQRHSGDGFSGGSFQRFEDEGGVELGRSGTNVYNSQLAP